MKNSEDPIVKNSEDTKKHKSLSLLKEDTETRSLEEIRTKQKLEVYETRGAQNVELDQMIQIVIVLRPEKGDIPGHEIS